MSETMHERPRKYNVATMRAHDYLYDSAFIVSDARDYARTAFKAAMASAQVGIQPVYRTMFSELRKYPRARIVYHPNCRLPDHIDCTYDGYLAKVQKTGACPTPELTGKHRFKYSAFPKKLLPVKNAAPDFHPPTPSPMPLGPTKPKNRGTQSIYRESSAQTIPWQPDGKAAETCLATPEVLYLEKFNWGPGVPYRLGDLPADFHTTEIINKMRHARTWNELVEKASFPRWMKKGDAIIEDVETKDWIFREAEIDELQDIRLELLHRIQSQQRQKQNSRSCQKLAKLWDYKKQEMERKVEHIRHTRDRELRKLTALHSGGGRSGLVDRMRAARGHGSMTQAAKDPTSDLYAPMARHGYQARSRHAEICYDPSLLSSEDHRKCAQPPAWLESCGQNLRRTCSGHHLTRDVTTLCERETKWSEDFLEQLHNNLKKARLGAATSTTAGPLRVLKPRKVYVSERPATPEVESVQDADEGNHQAALLLQRVLRGRAVQNLMYEGLTRAAELTEELKTTHGLQKEDRIRISREEAKSREYTSIRTEAEQKEDAISALVDELCGGAVSAALDFLEKELRRLKEERRQHAFILIALREKTMREAAEAGRRQKEIHRLREHDEMFKQILGVTQETVDVYLREIVQEGVNLAAEEDAMKLQKSQADKIDQAYNEGVLSTAEQHETVAELVQQFLLPEAHKQASRKRVAAMQDARVNAAREAIFGVVDGSENIDDSKYCVRCGCPLGALCRCLVCPIIQEATETTSNIDPRWKHTRVRAGPPEKSPGERFPPYHEFRCLLNSLIDEVALLSKKQRVARRGVWNECHENLRESIESAIDAKEIVDSMVNRAMGVDMEPATRPKQSRHYSRRVMEDALARTEPARRSICPDELPSVYRRRAEEARALADTACRCDLEEPSPTDTTTQESPKSTGITGLDTLVLEEKSMLLPSQLRVLEELRRCKCDTDATPSSVIDDDVTTEFTETTVGEAEDMQAYEQSPFEDQPEPSTDV